MSYFQEKLHLALLGMAKSQSDLRTRLADAYVYHLVHAEKHLPNNPEIQEFFAEMDTAFSKIQDEEKGSVAASIQQMSDQEVNEFFDGICGLVYKGTF